MTSVNQLTIFRPDVSQYQSQNFRLLEKSALEKIPGCIYTERFSDLEHTQQVIVISTSQTDIESLKKSLGNTKVVLWIHPNSGYDNISKQDVINATFPIIIGNAIRAQAVFQYTVQCFLKALGDLPIKAQWDKKRSYARTLKPLTLVIGWGHIGKLFSQFLELANYSFEICDPYENKKALSEFDLSLYDCFVLLPSLNKSTHHVLNRDFFKQIKSDAIIINPARGKLVDQSALIDFLKAHPKAFAYLDVFENEPCDFSKFDGLNNTYLSSHIAGVYSEIDTSIIEYERKVISDFINLETKAFKDLYHKVILEKRLKNDILI